MGKPAIKPINKRIENTGIFVFDYNSITETFTYSRPFSLEEAESLAEMTNSAIENQYEGAKGLVQGLTARGGSLINMSTLRGIVANNELMKDSHGERWLPTLEQGLALDNAGMFARGVLIDFGIVLYDGNTPDKEIAQKMMETARSRGYEMPVLASFTSLGLSNGGQRYGVTPKLASENGLITGQEAVKVLEKFYKGNSGVQRVGRDGYGNWSAYWIDCLDNFGEGCRVGRFFAQGSAKKLKEEALAFSPINESVDCIVSDAIDG